MLLFVLPAHCLTSFSQFAKVQPLPKMKLIRYKANEQNQCKSAEGGARRSHLSPTFGSQCAQGPLTQTVTMLSQQQIGH